MDDIHAYFEASSSKCSPTDIYSNTDTETDSDTDHLQANLAKKLCSTSSSQQHCSKPHPLSSKRGYNKKWEKEFTFTVTITKKHFVKFAEKYGISL